MIPNMGFGDWVIILVLVLLLFGAKRLPDLARAVGQSVNAFKKGLAGDDAGEPGRTKPAARKPGRRRTR